MNQSHPSLEQLVEFVHGQLPAERDAEVHAHLKECRSCREAYESEVRLTELLRSDARSNERELPTTVVAAVRTAIAQPGPANVAARLRALLHPITLIPGTLAIVAAIVLGIFAARFPAKAPAIDAAYYVNNHAALTASAPFSEDAPVPVLLTADDTAAEQQPASEPR